MVCLAREPPPVSRALYAISRTVTKSMSDFTCQCTDTMVATCTSSFASAYLCAAVVAIAVTLARFLGFEGSIKIFVDSSKIFVESFSILVKTPYPKKM